MPATILSTDSHATKHYKIQQFVKTALMNAGIPAPAVADVDPNESDAIRFAKLHQWLSALAHPVKHVPTDHGRNQTGVVPMVNSKVDYSTIFMSVFASIPRHFQPMILILLSKA